MKAEEIKPTLRGLRKCADWLSYCLSIGWPKSSLDFLERLWWEYHDRNGAVLSASRDQVTHKEKS